MTIETGTGPHDSVRAVAWEDDALQLLDQRKLPLEKNVLTCHQCIEVVDAIQDMVVRGAPAIGIAAAYGVVLAARKHFKAARKQWKDRIKRDLQALRAARPTAVNLMYAVDMMQETIVNLEEDDPTDVLLEKAQRFHELDILANKRMGQLGAALIANPCDVITHCNAGSLATGGFGTALGVIRQAWQDRKIQQVYADETRPWLQGARLTAWELIEDDIPVQLIADNCAAHLMRQGKVRWVIVGSDRIAANGDVANKIGTYGLAIAAKHHNVKVMVVAPTTTVDMTLYHGGDIPIEQRDEQEVLHVQGKAISHPKAGAWNPVFDVTPAKLIDAIVTERGVVLEPDTTKMKAMMKMTSIFDQD
ncbi:MAG: S-methyl-5-thioribose-1-phosphate isomerase [Gammaproteobacteria bacterium]|nr:MAG: S-methyl-5-thioribose-1-phosphate isomerase [Gammaproteobacteria bacterium]